MFKWLTPYKAEPPFDVAAFKAEILAETKYPVVADTPKYVCMKTYRVLVSLPHPQAYGCDTSFEVLVCTDAYEQPGVVLGYLYPQAKIYIISESPAIKVMAN